MSIADLQSLDISNLIILKQVLTDCSITRVAERLNLSQPSISRLLKRLRIAFSDPLLVRSGSGFVPTERGVAVREALADVLQRLDGIAAAKTAFVPAQATRVFSIACADCLAVALVPRIIATVAAAGPGLRIRFRSIDPAFDVFQGLKAGEIDLVIDNSPTPQESLRLAPLYDDDVVLMMRRGHPAASQLAARRGPDRWGTCPGRLPEDRPRDRARIQSRPVCPSRYRLGLHHRPEVRRASRPAFADRNRAGAELLPCDALSSAMARQNPF